jgi:hypothetical protein
MEAQMIIQSRSKGLFRLFFASVVRPPHMPRQIATLSTGERTLGARKGLFARVRPHMLGQV